MIDLPTPPRVDGAESNPIRRSTGFRLAVLFGSFFFLMIFSGIAGELIHSAKGLSQRSALLLMSVVQSVCAFIVPAWLTARFASSFPSRWLHLDKFPPVRAFIGVLIVFALALPAMNELIAFNSSIHLPSSMSGLEDKLRQWEDAAAQFTDVLLAPKGIAALLSGVLVIGIITGFAEEIFFRGALQGIFIRSGLGNAASIWSAAIIFSAIHFQFFGFIPRLVLALFFGYLLLWSRSLWLPVFAHALNNSVVVVSAALSAEGADYNSFETFGINEGFPWAAVASCAATAIFLWRYKGYFFIYKSHIR